MAIVAWKKGAFLLDRLVASAGCGIRVRRLGGDRAGEMRLTRFLRNGSVTPDVMVDAAARRLASRCAGRSILAIQDTTVVRSSGGGGLYLHACIALDEADGALLGLAQATFLKGTRGGQGDVSGSPFRSEGKPSLAMIRGHAIRKTYHDVCIR